MRLRINGAFRYLVASLSSKKEHHQWTVQCMCSNTIQLVPVSYRALVHLRWNMYYTPLLLLCMKLKAITWFRVWDQVETWIGFMLVQSKPICGLHYVRQFVDSIAYCTVHCCLLPPKMAIHVTKLSGDSQSLNSEKKIWWTKSNFLILISILGYLWLFLSRFVFGINCFERC